jgi:hypothetical protein
MQMIITDGSHAGQHVTVLGLSAVEPGAVRVRHGVHAFRVHTEQLARI